MLNLRVFNFDLDAVAFRTISSSTAFLTVTLMALLFVAPFASAEVKGSAPSSLAVEKQPDKGDYYVKLTWNFDGDEVPYRFQLEKHASPYMDDNPTSVHNLPGDGATRSFSGAIAKDGSRGVTYTLKVRAKWEQFTDSVGPWSNSVSITLP